MVPLLSGKLVDQVLGWGWSSESFGSSRIDWEVVSRKVGDCIYSAMIVVIQWRIVVGRIYRYEDIVVG